MRVKVNKTGKIFIGVTIFLGVAAVNTGNNLLYLIVSSLLSGMLIAGFISLKNLKNLRLTINFPYEVYASIPVKGKVGIKKEDNYYSFLIRVDNGFSKILFPYVDKKFRFKELLFIFPNRGYYEKVKLKISSDFPLGMFARFFETEIKVNLVVFPKPINTDLREFILEEEKGESKSFLQVKGYEDIKDIRDYRNEPMKLIHWKLSAKTQSLKVKDMVRNENRSVILSLNSVEGDLETKLSKLTYLINELMDRGFSVALKLDNTFIPPSFGQKHKLKLLRELAVYGKIS